MNSISHGWTVSEDTSRVSITDLIGFREAIIGPFIFTLVNSNPLISSVSVVAHAELNGTVVNCVDGVIEFGLGDLQEASINIIGKLFMPTM